MNPVIYSDSQHLVHSIQRKRPGKRFAPRLLTLLIKSLQGTSIEVKHVSAHTWDPDINAGNPNADNLAKIGASEAFGPLTLDQLPHNLLPTQERYWKKSNDHGLVTRPLERHGLHKSNPVPSWIRKRKHKLQVILRLLRAQSDHVNGDTNKCRLCPHQDPDRVHLFTCKRRSRQGKHRLTTLWTAAIQSSNLLPGAWLLYPQEPWPPPWFRPQGY